MKNKKTVQIIVWIIVAGMVISLVATVFTLF